MDGSVKALESNFTAILTPPIVVKIDKSKLYKSKTVELIFVDTTVNRKMSNRYQLGWFIPDIKIFNSKHEQVSLIGSFDFTQEKDNENYKKYLIKGNTILVPSIAIRDNDTDLMYWTKEYFYKIK